MRFATAMLVAVLLTFAPASATPRPGAEFSSADAGLKWINGYRAKPDLAHVPAAMLSLSHLGAFHDPESSGIYVGFIAGVLGANPTKAEALMTRLLALPTADHWVLVRAAAYSGLPDWKDLLRKFAPRLPTRQTMIQRYLDDKLPTLDHVVLEEKPTLLEKLKRSVSVPSLFSSKEPKTDKAAAIETNPELLDTLWGYYFASGAYGPIARIITLLPLSKDRDSAEKLMVGSMAKYTLASNATHDTELLAMLKGVVRQEPKETAAILDDVIDAAETVQTSRIRQDALAAVDDLKRKGPGSKQDASFWGQVGQGALALGCVAAAAAGQAEFGLPCVIGGAASSAALNFWSSQP